MHLLPHVLEQTLLEPQSPRHWHALFEAWSGTPESGPRRDVEQRLAATSFDDPRTDALRLTFLAWTSGDAQFVTAAAKRTLAVTPENPDRLAAFASFYSIVAMVQRATRPQFVAALEAAMVPEIVNRLGRSAAAMMPPSLAPRVPQATRRVAVVLPHIGNAGHTPTALAVNQCELLSRAGRTVHMFSCQELLPPLMAQYHGCGGGARLADVDRQHWQRVLPAGVGMTVSEPRLDLRTRWRRMFARVAEFDPDMVMLIGLYSPLAAALHAVRPVLGLCTNAVPPLAPVDVWLTADEHQVGDCGDVWRDAFPAPLGRFHPQRVKFAAGPFALRRDNIDLPRDAVVWVTVGLRLDKDIRPPWSTQMIEALGRHPDAVWLLLGCENRAAPEAVRNAPAGRLIVLPARTDVAAVLSLCDVFVNPPRMGGGFSVVGAMASALPVVSFADSDGGDKAGEHAVTEPDAYFRMLSDLTSSRERRETLGQQMRERFVRRFDLTSSGPALIEALDLTAAQAGARLRLAAATVTKAP